MSRLLLGLEFEEALPEPTRRELEQIIAALQAWHVHSAPSDAQYVVTHLHDDLSAERIVTNTDTIRWDTSTTSQLKAHVVGLGAGGAGLMFASAARRDPERRPPMWPPGITLTGDVTSSGAIPATILTAGTYTPTLTNVANLDASTAYVAQYLRVRNTVTVSGKVDVDPTAGAATQLGLSLPIASNFANAEECGGVAFASGIAGQGAAVRGDATNNRAEMVWVAVDLTNQPMYFTFSYQVI